ncbi:hypothetical protein PYW08_008105 [Mythimna loreyi]|uniref:Uncharacterized protein n=1 Tax=Mythimna loreyi TaxID=667449 RepID=A0ACC2QAM1_9NEOP|nr:hypothetical protein PYW08_008105 [Mythimna loreyi]
MAWHMTMADIMSLFPWKMGRPLVYDATCVDTLAPSHLPSSSCCAGAAAAAAENLKWRKYTNLVGNYIFEPFGIETLGSWGPNAHKLFKEVTKRQFQSVRNSCLKGWLLSWAENKHCHTMWQCCQPFGHFTSGQRHNDAEEFFDAIVD